MRISLTMHVPVELPMPKQCGFTPSSTSSARPCSVRTAHAERSRLLYVRRVRRREQRLHFRCIVGREACTNSSRAGVRSFHNQNNGGSCYSRYHFLFRGSFALEISGIEPRSSCRGGCRWSRQEGWAASTSTSQGFDQEKLQLLREEKTAL